MHRRQAAFSAQLQASVDNFDPDEPGNAMPRTQPSPSTISATAVAGSMQQSSFATEGSNLVEEDNNPSSSSSDAICASEAQEVAFQRAWLAYIWSRAASLGVEPQVCRVRAEHWGHLLLWGSNCGPSQQSPFTPESPFVSNNHSVYNQSPAVGAGTAQQQQGGFVAYPKELVEVHAGQLELARLGIDQQVWASRAKTMG